MNSNKCFLCDLLTFSKTDNLKTLFETQTQNDFENKFTSKIKHNACTQPNSNMIEKVSNDSNRSNNLIIFGIEEPNEALNELERQNHDKIKIRNLLVSFNLDSNKEVVEIKRLDHKKNGNSLRPILIKLIHYKTRIDILKRSKHLKDIVQYKSIAISLDYSKAKRLKIKMLIKNRIDLNKQLRDATPNANYYFSIRCGQITMISKQNEETKISNQYNNRQLTNLQNDYQLLKTMTNDLTNDYKKLAKVFKHREAKQNETNQLIKQFLKQQQSIDHIETKPDRHQGTTSNFS